MDNDTVLKLLKDVEDIQGLAIALNMLMLDNPFPLDMSNEYYIISAVGNTIEEKAIRIKNKLEEKTTL